MFKSVRKITVVSVIINIFFLLGFTALCIYKKDAIAKRFEKMFVQPSEKVLSTFNKEPYQFVNDTQFFSENARTISILFLGNSLTYTGVPEEEPDKTPRGLTSTAKEKDYVHLLVKRIAQEKKVNVIYSLTNIADFERHFMEAELDFSRFTNATVKNPNYVIFQIGENVANKSLTTNEQLFIARYTNAVNHFTNSTKIICLPWWQDAQKNMLITQVAMDSSAYLVDISHLGSGADKQNFAESYKKYKQPGVGTHPGDYGMKNIADCLWTVFNATIQSQE
ncbi:MAG: SGNH/GDSL hydrolase family protein [Treponema sp.]|nr:SGNH/GDSL hydrolase family protein [Treponema sp.]